jgi:hypothetical protein
MAIEGEGLEGMKTLTNLQFAAASNFKWKTLALSLVWAFCLFIGSSRRKTNAQ